MTDLNSEGYDEDSKNMLGFKSEDDALWRLLEGSRTGI